MSRVALRCFSGRASVSASVSTTAEATLRSGRCRFLLGSPENGSGEFCSVEQQVTSCARAISEGQPLLTRKDVMDDERDLQLHVLLGCSAPCSVTCSAPVWPPVRSPARPAVRL